MLGQRLKIPGQGTSGRKPSKPIIHTVKRGDSLSKISAQYNVKIKWIKATNKLTKNTVVLGQKLLIPLNSSNHNAAGKAVKKQPRFHKVKRGDTLSEIAEKYNSSMKAIIKANKLRNKTIMLGQRLKVPY